MLHVLGSQSTLDRLCQRRRISFRSQELQLPGVAAFREQVQFPSEGGALPASLPGIGWSDHWAFWQEGFPALMITDTAPFRYPHYHTPDDTPDKVDYERLARVTEGVEKVIRRLTQCPMTNVK